MSGKKKQPVTSPEHEADQREMDRLELEIKSLKQTIKNLDGIIDSTEKRAELWQEYAHGLEARVKIAEMDVKKKQASTLSPLLMGVAAGALGSYFGSVAARATRPETKS